MLLAYINYIFKEYNYWQIVTDIEEADKWYKLIFTQVTTLHISKLTGAFLYIIFLDLFRRKELILRSGCKCPRIMSA